MCTNGTGKAIERDAASFSSVFLCDADTHTRLVLANCFVLQDEIAFKGVISFVFYIYIELNSESESFLGNIDVENPPELAVTCKTVVRIINFFFEDRFAHNSESVSRDPSVDRTTKKETERGRGREKGEWGLYLNFSVAWLVNLSLKSTQMGPAPSYKEGKDKNTDERSCKNWQGRGRERESSGERRWGNERCFDCFLKEHSALLFCQLQWSVLWRNESPGSADCHEYCTVWSGRLWCGLASGTGCWPLKLLVSNEWVPGPSQVFNVFKQSSNGSHSEARTWQELRGSRRPPC